jgi:hypothetical protein
MIYYDFIFHLSIALALQAPSVTSFPSLNRWGLLRRQTPPEKRLNTLDTNPNGSTFLWLLQDDYSGKNFFECVPRLQFDTPSPTYLQEVYLLQRQRSNKVSYAELLFCVSSSDHASKAAQWSTSSSATFVSRLTLQRQLCKQGDCDGQAPHICSRRWHCDDEGRQHKLVGRRPVSRKAGPPTGCN